MKTPLPTDLEEALPLEPVKDPRAAELSATGTWGETQVIESIKEATFRGKDPRRVLNGQATQAIGGVFHPVVADQGQLIIPKPRLRERLRRLLKLLKS